MAELSDILVYICKHYPSKDDLSKARLNKLVYLADWRSAIQRGQQLTNIQWRFNHYGPYVEAIIETVHRDQRLEIIPTANYYGEYKELIKVRSDVPEPSLNQEERDVLQFVIDRTAEKSWDAFISLVYSTYPIITQLRYADLDLVSLAQEYKHFKPLLAVSPG